MFLPLSTTWGKQGVPATRGLTHVWTQRPQQHVQDLSDLRQMCSQNQVGGNGHKLPSQTKKLFPHPQLMTKKNLIITNGVSLDTQTVLVGRHVPNSRWPPQNKLSGILGDFISHTALFGHFKSLFAWILRVMILVLWFYSCVYVCLSVCISWAFAILFGFQIFKNSLNFFCLFLFWRERKKVW